jgi:hypothetical protein
MHDQKYSSLGIFFDVQSRLLHHISDSILFSIISLSKEHRCHQHQYKYYLQYHTLIKNIC